MKDILEQGTEFDCRRISLIVHRSASDKLAVDSLVLLSLWSESFIPPKREKECLANCFESKICQLVSGKLFKLMYTQLQASITSPVLNECP